MFRSVCLDCNMRVVRCVRSKIAPVGITIQTIRGRYCSDGSRESSCERNKTKSTRADPLARSGLPPNATSRVVIAMSDSDVAISRKENENNRERISPTLASGGSPPDATSRVVIVRNDSDVAISRKGNENNRTRIPQTLACGGSPPNATSRRRVLRDEERQVTR